MSTWELNEIARRGIAKHKVVSAFLGYHGYPRPGVLCTSVNEVVVHGIPRKDVCSRTATSSASTSAPSRTAAAATRPAPSRSATSRAEKRQLIDAAREALDAAIEQCRPGNRLGDIGWAVQSHAEAQGYSVVRQFVGHGIGRQMHEEPQVPNYGDGRPGSGKRLKPVWSSPSSRW